MKFLTFAALGLFCASCGGTIGPSADSGSDAGTVQRSQDAGQIKDSGCLVTSSYQFQQQGSEAMCTRYLGVECSYQVCGPEEAYQP